MSAFIFDDPDHSRHRAEEARLLSEKLNDPIAKAAMLRIAKDFEQIAEQAQKRASGAGRLRDASDEMAVASQIRRNSEGPGGGGDLARRGLAGPS